MTGTLPFRDDGTTSTRPLHRPRLLLDRGVTPANVLDAMCEWHPDSAMVDTGSPLPYPCFDDRRVSPLQALEFVARTGDLLRGAGMRRNARVAIFKQNSVDYVFLSLAVIRAGGIAVPVNPGMPLATLRRYIEHTGSNILCCDRRTFRERIGEQTRLPTIKQWIFTDDPQGDAVPTVVLATALTEAGSVGSVTLSPDARVVLAHTSGTTGDPKAVIGTTRSVMAGIRVHFLTEPAFPGIRAALAGPFSHLVFLIGLTTAMVGNIRTHTIAGGGAADVLRVVERERINVFVGFPDLYLRMYAAGLDAHDLSAMRVWIGVADTSQEVHMRAFCQHGALLRVFGRPLVRSLFVEPLGSSEIGGPAIRRVWLSCSRLRSQRRIGRRMLGGPRVRVVDATGAPAAPGQVGRLMVKGPTLFAGYWHAHERPNDVLAGGWWATGDVVYRDRWRRLHHLDREADVIRTAAGAFYTLPAEDVLHSYAGVLEAVVFGVSDGARAEVPVAVLWLTPEAASAFDEQQLLHWASSRIEGPIGLRAAHVVAPDEIPRGLTGKVLKRTLRDRYANGSEPLT